MPKEKHQSKEKVKHEEDRINILLRMRGISLLGLLHAPNSENISVLSISSVVD